MREEVGVLASVSQRRNVDLYGIQAKEEILTKPAGSSLGIHVSVCGCEDSDVDATSN